MNDDALARELTRHIDRVIGLGAEYVDARHHLGDKEEVLVLYDGNLEVNDTAVESGIGVRALVGGAWGFAATSDLGGLEDLGDVGRCFDRALANGRTAATLMAAPLAMGHREPHRSEYRSPVQIDPFEVDLADKLAFVRSVDRALDQDWVDRRMVVLQLQRKRIRFWSSEGTYVEKDLTNAFGTMTAMALDSEGRMQRRSHSLRSTGFGTRGWEMVTRPDLFSDHAERVRSELRELVAAPRLEPARRSVILLPGQGHLQVHETIGHALELDRILGYELSFAGGSFVTLDDFGQLQYGSDRLSVSAYGGIENSPGSFGFDDDGTPERDYLLIDKGVLVDALSSRTGVHEANDRAGRRVFRESGGVARSTAFYRAPIDRMSNVNIVPGQDGTLDDIVASTEDGVILDNPTSWSIGSNREHFHFGCEIAWEVKGGRRTRVLKEPTYQGHTLEFYRSLSAVGDSSTWQVAQVNNCGKGEPNQIMQIGHGVPVVRFDDVITGGRA